MAINLSRNTKVYFTTNLSTVSGVPNSPPDAAGGYSNTNLFEVSVQDGYSLSQATQEQTVSVNEAGSASVRGDRSFNTQLDPVDFSFSTYIRPDLNGVGVVEIQERVLWNALFGADAIGASLPITTYPTRAATTAAAAATATVVFTGVATGLVAGDVVNFSKATNHPEWNQAAKILTINPSTNTTCTVEYFKAPGTAAGSTASAQTTAARGQWGISGTGAGDYSYASTMGSNKNQLQAFGLIFVIDNVVYAVDNCVLDSATIDFGLDQIAMIQWAGKGARIRELTTVTGANLLSAAKLQANDAAYITNKLSTMTLSTMIGGSKATGGKTYSIAITGGQIAISNNVTYLTPNNLGKVNKAITYFTGSRSVSGNVTAYLRTGEGTTSSGALFTDLLASSDSTTEPKCYLQLEMGGASNPNRVEFEMPGVKLQIPTIDVQDVVSTTINFKAQAHEVNYVNNATDVNFDLTRTNELMVRYYANA